MKRRDKIAAAIVGLVSSAVLIFAYASGPDPRYTGAPGDDSLACSTSGCHTGTPLNGGGGNVAVNFPNGLFYTPGVQQTFTIVVTDSLAKLYGFQMTARLESNLANGQAGDFTAGTQQYVLCDNATFKTPARPCPANAQVQFIEHNKPFSTNTISVIWTAPATNVGNVHIYVAANAANGDGNNTGDHIYNANYVLAPQTAPTKPTITGIAPPSVTAGSAGITLTIAGSGFVSGAVVKFNGAALQTAFVNSNALTANVTADLIAKTGTATVTVANPDGTESGGVSFNIVTIITSISPTVVVAGSAGIQLAVTGAGFSSGSVVNFNATGLQTAFVSATSLTATLPASLIVTPGMASITVVNPDGSASNSAGLLVFGKPSITSVVNGASFQPGIQSGSWSTVFGTSLSATTRTWNTDTEIINGKLPLSLDGVSVTVNNKRAAVYFISPTQINFQAPDDAATGTVNVTVTNSNGTSDPAAAQLQSQSPGFFMFDPQGRRYVAGLVADINGTLTFLGPPGLFGTDTITRPAKPGEILVLFGTGFGPTNPPVPAGQVFTGAARTITTPTVTIGGVQVQPSGIDFAGITGAGLYQLNVHVPDGLTTGDQAIVLTVNGTQTQSGAFVTVSTK